MRVAAVVVKQRTILPTIMNDTDGANLNASRRTCGGVRLRSHDKASTPRRTASAVKMVWGLILSVPAVVHGIAHTAYTRTTWQVQAPDRCRVRHCASRLRLDCRRRLDSTSGDSEHVPHFPSPLRDDRRRNRMHHISSRPLFGPRCRQLRCGCGWGSEPRGHRKVVRGVAVGSAGMVDPGIDGLEKRAG